MRDNQSVSAKVMNQIKSGQVSMRPRWHFVLMSVLGVSFLGALTALTTYLANLVVYKVRQETHGMHGQGFVPSVNYYADNFPWVALLIVIVSFILWILLARRFDFSYRLGRWAFLVGILVILSVGSALAFTNFNQHVENIGPMQRFYGQQMQKDNGQQMQNQNGQNQGEMIMQQNGQHWQDE